ncbi:substrate-binding domain-containing protein [Candidatus Bathyarchaeota archaeon]|nr:substrate-binding domain-containing protein [Candidatus Bathyarchaeota archaeon]
MQTWTKLFIIAVAATVLIIAGSYAYFQSLIGTRLLVSTTTSLYETGLLNATKQAFEVKYPINMAFIAVGTGQAILQAQGGSVDTLLVHSPSQEAQFLAGGDGICRKIIAYNFFTIVGPPSDPAHINGSSVTTALQKIVDYGRNHTTGRIWVSRGDGSGTHTKEKSLWAKANFNYTQISAEPWYANAGQGMSQTLNMANEFEAYTLADTGTYWKLSKDGTVSLIDYITEAKDLLNVYSVMAVNQTKHPSVNFTNAITFIRYLISDEGQELIENYGKDTYGQSLFHSTVQLLKQNSTLQIVRWIKEYAFIKEDNESYECPPQYRDSRYPDLYA